MYLGLSISFSDVEYVKDMDVFWPSNYKYACPRNGHEIVFKANTHARFWERETLPQSTWKKTDSAPGNHIESFPATMNEIWEGGIMEIPLVPSEHFAGKYPLEGPSTLAPTSRPAYLYLDQDDDHDLSRF